ncbi:MAG: zinc-ribbon domain-containing protein [Rhodobacteraceae bacterium]|nr:zinc-ribbon domain-containing protein [Paracoccaceae bacterium]
MRLICPNCDAQYEVPDEVIPAEGRDVQCSNCGKTWFQEHPDALQAAAQAAPDHADDDDTGEEVAPTPPPDPSAADDDPTGSIYDEVSAPNRRNMSPDVADILREEAEQEAQARAKEREALESQPDLGLQDPVEDEADRRARQARDRMARMRGEEPDPEEDRTEEVASAVAATVAGSRRDLLPDIDEINSTLRSGNERPGRAENRAAQEQPAKARGNRGFRLGFVVSLLIACLAVVVYSNGPQISERFPQADPYVNSFIASADNARASLDAQFQSLMIWINDQTSDSGE